MFFIFNLPSWDPIYSNVSRFGVYSTKQTQICYRGARGWPQKLSKCWNRSPMKKVRKTWGCSAWKRFLRDLIAVFQYIKGAYKKDRLFTKACSDRTSGSVFKLKEVRSWSDIGRNFLQCSGEMLEQNAHRSCGFPIQHQCSRSGWMVLWATWSGEKYPCPWTRWSLKISSNLNHSIRWFYDFMNMSIDHYSLTLKIKHHLKVSQ